MSGGYYMGIPRERIPWAPTVRQEVCSGCQSCVETCPNDVLAFDEQKSHAIVVKPLVCVVLCDKCAQFCPEDAIIFPDRIEFRKQLLQLARDSRQTPSPA
ncbi:MAG: ferredoxin family protein [Planctomycetaceae bacterium]|nr:MAG: ferredoxin family protein [Planctomycetaceae bacterium]